MRVEALDVHGLVKPLMRGRLHVGGLVAAVPAVVVLLLAADSQRARAAAGVYGASLVAVFAVSAAYHRVNHSPQVQRLLRRADHATIFCLIAGTYTPIAVVAIRGRVGWSLVASAWALAVVGFLLKIVWFHRARVAGAVLYIVLGWMVVLAMPEVADKLSGAELALVVAGGLLYTGGTLVLVRRRPDPSPRVFGYHEVWHTFVVLAAACHYASIYLVVSGA